MWNLESIRTQFPALAKPWNGRAAIYFDGPAGSQTPRGVAEAVTDYLLGTNANCGGMFPVSQASDQVLASARTAMTDFLQVEDADEIVFGANMTSLTFALSRALAETWAPGDEIIVSRLDHDANVTPWVLAAESVGVKVRTIEVEPADCTLCMESFRNALNRKTKLIAVGAAANSTGTINPVREIAAAGREAGALTFVDAVHLAPHRRLNVADWGCDFAVCSAYKFFGPHVGVLWGRKALLESLRPRKLRPAPNGLPGKWMTGTQNHEGIAGAAAAVNYLAGLSELPATASRRERLDRAFQRIEKHEQQLASRLLDGLQRLSEVKVWGITDAARFVDRVPTFSLTHARLAPREMAERLLESGIFAWAGNHYALPWTEAMGLEPQGTLRVGMLHYNTLEEVDRLLDCVSGW